jgi:chloramphenicol O-acetyltransferase
MYMDKAKARLEELHLLHKLNLVGCSTGDIQAIENKIGVPLPIAYQEFLLWMGRVSQLFKGNNYRYFELLDLQNIASDLLEENHEKEVLTPNAFVFLVHQGYQFDFFRLSEEEDPPVYWYCEGKTNGFVQTHEHFSDYILDFVEGYSRIRQEISERIEKMAQKYPQRAKEMAERSRKEGDYDGPI